ESVIPIVVGLDISHEVWRALKFAFASPLNTRIFNLPMQMQKSQASDESVTRFLQRLKANADELVVAGRPVPLPDFNIYIFKGLKPEFKDLVTTFSSRSDPITYSELLGLLLSHEFLHGDSLNTINISSSVGTTPTTVHLPTCPNVPTPIPLMVVVIIPGSWSRAWPRPPFLSFFWLLHAWAQLISPSVLPYLSRNQP
ncbi:UBN2 domain-containing protein, partial [Cephalotus follicularis]